MKRIEDYRLFGIARINANTEGHTEPLTDDQIRAARFLGWKMPVAVYPACEDEQHLLDAYQRPLPFVERAGSAELGACGVRGVLEIGDEEVGVESAVAHARLTVDGIVPPLELTGVILALPTTTGERVFAAPSPEHCDVLRHDMGMLLEPVTPKA